MTRWRNVRCQSPEHRHRRGEGRRASNTIPLLGKVLRPYGPRRAKATATALRPLMAKRSHCGICCRHAKSHSSTAQSMAGIRNRGAQHRKTPSPIVALSRPRAPAPITLLPPSSVLSPAASPSHLPLPLTRVYLTCSHAYPRHVGIEGWESTSPLCMLPPPTPPTARRPRAFDAPAFSTAVPGAPAKVCGDTQHPGVRQLCAEP